MPVNERFEDPGSFEIQLDPELGPLDEVLNQIVELGHIVITPQWVEHPSMFTESVLLGAARYSGPLLETEWGTDTLALRGAGNVWHMGDSFGNGPILARDIAFSADVPSTVLAQLTASVDGLIPQALTAGTITDTGVGTYTGTFYGPQTALECIRTYMLATGMHYRVNPDFSVDACLATRDEVYVVTSPTVVGVRHGFGSDPVYAGIEPTSLRTRRDATRWVSRSVIARENYDGSSEYSSFKDRTTNPYFDPQGNALVRNVVQSGPASDALDLDTFHDQTLVDWGTFDAQEIDTTQYEFSGSFKVGDYIYVYDPPSGFFDSANEIRFRGEIIWPKKVRVTEDEWELAEGMGVYYRPGGAAVTTADYIDLSRYVRWER